MASLFAAAKRFVSYVTGATDDEEVEEKGGATPPSSSQARRRERSSGGSGSGSGGGGSERAKRAHLDRQQQALPSGAPRAAASAA